MVLGVLRITRDCHNGGRADTVDPGTARELAALYLQVQGRVPLADFGSRVLRAPLSHGLGVQGVSGGANGADDIGLAVGVDRFAQAADVDIDGARLDVDVEAPDSV